MSTAEAIDQALDGLREQDEPRGTVEVERDSGRAEVDVVDADRLGVRVRRVKVDHGEDRDIAEEAAGLSERLRSLGERVEPVEVDPGLGGAILRTRPEELRDREFYQVEVDGPREVEVRRFRAGEDGERRGVDWTMTREQLGRLVDELEG